jgi:ribosomal protein S18 acetylase RimI-like enzyme
MDALIRAAEPADVDGLVELALRAFAPVDASFRNVLGEQVYRAVYPDWAAEQEHDVRVLCADDAAMVSIAEENGQPVGFVGIRVHSDRNGEIDMLAVDPAAQRDGVGTALTQYAIEQLRALGVTLVWVSTGGDPGHVPARRTYEKTGFVGLPLVRYYMNLEAG